MTARIEIRVAIVDDHVLFREGVAALLDHHAELQVVGQGSTSADAMSLTRERTPDILLLDVELHDHPASVTVRRIRRANPATKIVILTMHRDGVLRDEMLKAGAAAFITKTIRSSDLIRVLRAIAKSKATSAGVQESRTDSPRLLSRREMEVIREMASGHSNRDIARVLSITEGTVKRHAVTIFAKLGSRSRLQAVRKAELLGLLEDEIRTSQSG